MKIALRAMQASKQANMSATKQGNSPPFCLACNLATHSAKSDIAY
jgi:hypothetical protein